MNTWHHRKLCTGTYLRHAFDDTAQSTVGFVCLCMFDVIACKQSDMKGQGTIGNKCHAMSVSLK